MTATRGSGGSPVWAPEGRTVSLPAWTPGPGAPTVVVRRVPNGPRPVHAPPPPGCPPRSARPPRPVHAPPPPGCPPRSACPPPSARPSVRHPAAAPRPARRRRPSRLLVVAVVAAVLIVAGLAAWVGFSLGPAYSTGAPAAPASVVGVHAGT
jgi:hypothetical protein